MWEFDWYLGLILFLSNYFHTSLYQSINPYYNLFLNIYKLQTIFLKNHKCNICIHRNDVHFLNNIIDKSKIILIEDGEFLDFGQKNLRVLFTPGHTPGCICLVGKKFLFSGDTLFYRGIGRMDFPGGSRMDMKKSLLKLMSLPDDYIVFPGHGNSTTIGDEKKNNPFLSWL